MDAMTAVVYMGEIKEWLLDPATFPERPGMKSAAADMLDIVSEIVSCLAEARHG